VAGAPHHVFGHGTGASAALLYAAANPGGVASLTLASPVFGRPFSEPPSASAGGLPPWAASLARSPAPASAATSAATAGAKSVCFVDSATAGNPGLYRAWAPAAAAELEAAGGRVKAGTPTLLTAGKGDLPEVLRAATPEAAAVSGEAGGSSLDKAAEILNAISVRQPGSGAAAPAPREPPLEESAPSKSPFTGGAPGLARATYGRSAHLPHLEEREKYLLDLFEFLTAVDEAAK